MSDEILRSSAALNALKRHQLVSLSKRYGLKASGKNVEMIDRLQEYAVTHAGDLDFYIPEPALTPGPSVMSNCPTPEPASPFGSNCRDSQVPSLIPTPLNHKLSKFSVAPRPSDAWEVLSESGASLISPKKAEGGMAKSESMRSWKSSNNGESLTEFGGNSALSTKSDRDDTNIRLSGQHDTSPRSSSSMRALATSLTRRGSRILLGRSTSASSRLNLEAEQEAAQAPQQEEERVEEVVDDIPPSPASTVGVPRRHSTISIHERPSTIRLCSPAPSSADEGSPEDDPDELPFFGNARNIRPVKERRSMAPLRSPMGDSLPMSSNVLSRKSMPAMSGSQSTSMSSIYPPLPTLPSDFAKASSIPGSFPPLTPLPPTPQPRNKLMVFGSPVAQGVSNQQFSDAAQAILKEMNAKLPNGGVTFGQELLKGKKAEVDKLVHINKDLGTGGWGFGRSGSSTGDRYAEAHQREFAKMRSISKTSIAPKSSASRQVSDASLDSVEKATAPLLTTKRKHDISTSTTFLPSAPNGLPLHASEREGEDRQLKRKRLSNGPNYLGSLKEAGKSIANILGEEKGNGSDAALRKMKERREKRRSSLTKNKSKVRTMSSRFGFFRNKKDTLAAPSTSIAASTSSNTSNAFIVPAPTMPRKTSVYAPRELPQPRKHFDLEASLARRPTVISRTSANLPNVVKNHSEVIQGPQAEEGRAQKDRSRSTSTQTLFSTMSSEAKRRSKVPDFAPASLANDRAGMASTNTLGLPKSSSMSSSLALSVKKQSQAEIIRNARPAPLPPSLSSHAAVHGPPSSSFKPASIQRSSTLYLPTASSLARMQATIKPNAERPLPAPPTDVGQPQMARPGSTVQPFVTASSRDNHLFESNFNLAKPKSDMAPPSLPMLKPQVSNGGLKSPMKGKPASLASARVRARASGLSAVKSKGNLGEEMEIKRKRSEIKAKQGRMAEERELREMLSGVRGLEKENVDVDVDVDM